ncbi:hypothetical protein Goshw_021120 [Gossypium schwendimanii]|uniref:Uncharacterized protein n=1 Tax=Gossypium schwendimanii TaxID=34291 RepID=A0A7J9MEW1_GOSSC|nr:hypothetical protein [Gossypium schwendimanii]
MLKELGVWEKSLVNVDGHDDEAVAELARFEEQQEAVGVADGLLSEIIAYLSRTWLCLKGDNAALRYMFAERKKLQLKDRDGDASVKFDAGAGDDCD